LIAGTNPDLDTDVLAVTNLVQAAQGLVSFPTRPGREYTLEFSTNFFLSPPATTWVDIPPPEGVFAETNAVPGSAVLVDTNAPADRIYRIRVRSLPTP
jgi:hypothetical protein